MSRFDPTPPHRRACVAAALDWNDEQPLRRALRLADGGGRRDANDGATARERRRIFARLFGASSDSSSARTWCTSGVGDGVVRCLEELMCPERGVAVLCNPAPAHRAGAAEFLETLRRSSFEFSRVDVTSALLRVGMEEETEDITLQMFAVKKRGARGSCRTSATRATPGRSFAIITSRCVR